MRNLLLGLIPLVVLAGAVSAPTSLIPGLPLGMPFAAMGPGPTADVLSTTDAGEEIVAITGAPVDPTTGELRMLTISVKSDFTLAQALRFWVDDEEDLVPINQVIPRHKSSEQVERENAEAFTNSESAATLAALNYLNYPLETHIVAVSGDGPSAGLLAEGATLTGIDDTAIDVPETAVTYIQSQPVGATVTLHTDAGDIPVTLAENPDRPGTAYAGLLLQADASGDMEIDYHLADVGGPSAGLMFSLGVVDKLDPRQITGGKKVAGTGTIAPDGTVGPIGGGKYKIIAAADAGAEVFLAPRANCAEIVASARTHHIDMPIIAVDTLAGAVDQLSSAEPELCD
ncbi:MAG: S16 family serine protease [Corynebacterium sp.]|nr:S16 family serine protease [Corynebacterium sp.]